MKILVIGSGGMLGHITVKYLRSRGYEVSDISKTKRIDNNTKLINVLDQKFEEELLTSHFDIIINCAALLIQASEVYKTQAIMINTWFPHKLEEVFKDTKTRVIHVSTSGVFSGENGPYLENCMHNSKSFYGKTKSLGEIDNEKDLTIRVDVMGPNLFNDGTGLFNWFVKENGNVVGYNQTFFNGITTLEFAKFIEYTIQNPIGGIYHLGACETISKSKFLTLVKEVFTLNSITIKSENNIKTNHTLLNSRDDVKYQPKTYLYMLEELKEWMLKNASLYQHYEFLRYINKY